MDAIKLLKEDHDRMKKLLKQAEESGMEDAQKRRQLFAFIRRELKMHEQLEETLLYPALKEQQETRELAMEGFHEHAAADLMLDKLAGIEASDENWRPQAKVFKELLEHHMEEEEGEMFKQAKKVLGKDRLEQMGAEMERMKSESLPKAA